VTTAAPIIWADLYLRLSDPAEGALDGREATLRAAAAALGWQVHRVIIENDLSRAKARTNGGPRPASAFKRQRIQLPNGTYALRTVRPGFRSMLHDLGAGQVQAILAEDLDRLLRQPRDNEDLLDAVELAHATVRSISGSITLTAGGTDAERMTARIMAAVANKSSADTGRRVSQARTRLATQSWHGGRRPFGYQPDPDAPQYAKRLRQVPAEAAVIRRYADAVFHGRISLKGAVAELNAGDVRTVTGAAWATRTLVGVLTSGAVAGLALHDGEIIGASDAIPEPILDVDTWQALRDKLRDPARRTTTANAPRWLVSCFATCGVCGRVLTVGGAGRTAKGTKRSPAYVGKVCGHVRRSAEAVDHLVAEAVIGWLERYADSQRLRPAPRAGGNAKALRAEQRRLSRRRDQFRAMAASGDMDPADVAAMLRTIGADLDRVATRLAACADAPDPIEEFRQGTPARQVWAGLSLARQRAVVQVLVAKVVAERATSRGRGFDPDSITLVWHDAAVPAAA
jgi:DNA invertase Pin-like site-specific DNA recombinase